MATLMNISCRKPECEAKRRSRCKLVTMLIEFHVFIISAVINCVCKYHPYVPTLIIECISSFAISMWLYNLFVTTCMYVCAPIKLSNFSY